MPSSTDILFLDHVGVIGGAELSLRDVAMYFGQRGRVVLLADGPFREMLERSGVRVDVVAGPAAFANARRESGVGAAAGSSLGLLRLLGRLYRPARRARVLYANSQKAFVVAACLGVLTRRPVIWHLRDVLNAEHFSRVNRLVTTRLAGLCNARVIANSHATRQALIESGGHPDRVVTIHNGLAPDALDAVNDDDAARCRAELDIDPSVWLVGAFSRLAPWKGQHVLLEAMAQAPDVHALIVGDALFGETAYRDRLHRQIEQMRLGGRVHMVGFRDDVPRLMKACDAVAHTSIAPEPFGRVIVEAMLARRPVVATHAGGACEIIARDDQGMLIAPGDAKALARALERLRTDEALAGRMASAGRTRAEQAFSVQTMLTHIEEQVMLALGDEPLPVADDAADAKRAGSGPVSISTPGSTVSP